MLFKYESEFIDEKCLIQFAMQKEDPVKQLPTHWENIGNVMILVMLNTRNTNRQKWEREWVSLYQKVLEES